MKLTDITKELFDYIVVFRQKVASGTVADLNTVHYELETVFHNMETKLSSQPSLQTEYRQVKYPLVVLADEIILTSAWSEAKRWEQFLLEKKYFSTNIAGNQFFKLLEKTDHMSVPVLTVFFHCLAFGFRGGFAANDPAVLRLQKRLLARILPDSKNAKAKVFAEAYRVDDSGTRKLSRLWKWSYLVVGAVLFALLLVSVERLLIWPMIVGWSMDEVTTAPGVAEPAASAASTSAVPAAAAAPTEYTVQLGIFKSKTLALHFSSQMEQRGITSKVFEMSEGGGGPQYSAVSGTFDNQTDASVLLQKAQTLTPLVTKMRIVEMAQAVGGKCIAGCK